MTDASEISRLQARLTEVETEEQRIRGCFRETLDQLLACRTERDTALRDLREGAELLTEDGKMRRELDLCRFQGPTCISAGRMPACFPCRRRDYLCRPSVQAALQRQNAGPCPAPAQEEKKT